MKNRGATRSVFLFCALLFTIRTSAVLANDPAHEAVASSATASAVEATTNTANDPSVRESALNKASRGSDLDAEIALLAKARTANEDLYAALQAFVCREEIQRFRGNLKADSGKQLDTVTTNLSFENGVEHYSEIRQNTRPRNSLSSLPGAWSEGEFGTLLSQTERLLRTQPVTFVAYSNVNGAEAGIYQFEVPEAESPWDLEVDGRHYHVPFRTSVWLSAGSGEILKIARISTTIPPDTRISEIQWEVDLQAVTLSGKQWLLPKTGAYSVLYDGSNRKEWNRMSFDSYRRYGSEALLRFDTTN